MARYVLRIVDGSAPANELELAGTVEIGRDPHVGLPLAQDQSVSYRHARASAHPEGALVEDLGSRNGTFVSGVRIAEPTLARQGDRIVVGDTTLEVCELPSTEYVLELVDGGGARRQVALAGPLEVGRDPAAGLALADDHLVSRLHARLTPLSDGVGVDDLGSRNGTFVNGQRIEHPTLVKPGERITVGSTTFEVRRAPARELVVEVVGPHAAPRQVAVSEPLEVGREQSAGVALVGDYLVSRAHARLTPSPDGAVVEDLGSRNGTFVNGALIEGPTHVGPGGRIVVGQTVLKLRAAGEGGPGLTMVRTAARPVLQPGAAGGDAPRDEPALPASEVEESEAPRDRRRAGTFAVCAAALFMAVLDNLVVLFALPSIQEDLDASVQQLEWTVNAFTLAFAVFLLPAATLGDRFGRKRVFVVGISLFTVASAVCALAPSIDVFLVFRAVQGFGGAMITPLSLTILSAAFPAEKRGLVLGAWSGIAGLAVAVGPVVGGVLVTDISWHWIFWVNVPIGATLVPLCLLLLRESHGPSTRLDLPGLALCGAGFFGIVFGLIRASDLGWTSIQVVASIAGGCLLVAAFVLWELRTPAPMLPMWLFRSRTFSAANVASLCMYIGLFGSLFLLSQFLQVALGYSALTAGVRSLPWTGMPIFVAPIAGILTERIGGRPLMALGLGLQTVAFCWLALVLGPGVPYLDMVGPFLLGGIGMGLFFAPVAHVILGSVGLEEEGQASGTNNAIRELGGVMGVAIMTTIFASHGSFASPQDFTDGIIPPLWVGAVILGLGTLAALAIPGMHPRETGLTMSSALPAVGGFTPGVTLVRPVPSLAEVGVRERAPSAPSARERTR